MTEDVQPKKKVAKLVIEKQNCIGCGTCTVLAEKAFTMNKEGVSEVLPNWEEEDPEKLIKVAKSCPVGAISVFDEEGNVLS